MYKTVKLSGGRPSIAAVNRRLLSGTRLVYRERRGQAVSYLSNCGTGILSVKNVAPASRR